MEDNKDMAEINTTMTNAKAKFKQMKRYSDLCLQNLWADNFLYFFIVMKKKGLIPDQNE